MATVSQTTWQHHMIKPHGNSIISNHMATVSWATWQHYLKSHDQATWQYQDNAIHWWDKASCNLKWAIRQLSSHVIALNITLNRKWLQTQGIVHQPKLLSDASSHRLFTTTAVWQTEVSRSEGKVHIFKYYTTHPNNSTIGCVPHWTHFIQNTHSNNNAL